MDRVGTLRRHDSVAGSPEPKRERRNASARSARPGSCVQAHGTGHPLELDRADLPEGDVAPLEASTTSWLTSTSLAPGVGSNPHPTDQRSHTKIRSVAS